MKITFACNHHATIGDASMTAPICWCGESRIQAVTSPPPRFTGACSGPFATYRVVDPITVSLTSRPLTLKESE